MINYDLDWVTLSQTERTKYVKELAYSYGFDLVGIANVENDYPEGEFLNQWLENGYHGEMKWMEDERRQHPRLVMQDCESVVAVGVFYHDGKTETSDPKSDSVKIAKYALYDDYHRTFSKSVKKFTKQLNELSKHDSSFKWYVDTGPMLEKAWANRAGLGFIGKNTCIIHPRKGSWFFLGVVLTNVKLISDTQVMNACGTCTKCLDACPTNAFIKEGVLDATKCISYLTIEMKNEVENNLQKELDGWLFGCDVCQDVCPYNLKFSKFNSVNSILGKQQLSPFIDINTILNLETEEDFVNLLGQRSAVRRAGLKSVKRTASYLKVFPLDCPGKK